MTAARRGRPGYDLDSLLDKAVAVFTERGFDGASMEDLSRRLGITKSAIYHHVESKDQLLALALDRALDGLSAVVDEAEALPLPAVDRLDLLLRGSVRVLVEQLPFVTLLVRVRGNTSVERRALARRRDLDRRVAALMSQAVADGDIRPDIDPALTSRLLFGLVNSLTEWLQPRRGMDSAALADAVVATAFEGLRVPRAACAEC
jgi:AcrR family transcriptional regulator